LILKPWRKSIENCTKSKPVKKPELCRYPYLNPLTFYFWKC